MTNPYQSYTPSLEQSLTNLVEAYNLQVTEDEAFQEEFKTLQIRNLELVQETTQLKTRVATLTQKNIEVVERLEEMVKGTTTVKKLAQDHMTLLSQARREKEQFKDRFDQASFILSGYKQLGSPKKIREQIKAYKDKAATHVSAINALKSEIKSYRTDVNQLTASNHSLNASLTQANITTIWSEEGDHLMVFPAPLTMAVNGKAEKQLTLLFMNRSGCGKLIGIDEEGEPLLCTMPKGGLRPRKATMDKAGATLRKFRKQGWKITSKDLAELRGG